MNGPTSTCRPAPFEDLPSTPEPAAAFQRRSTEQGALFKADAARWLLDAGVAKIEPIGHLHGYAVDGVATTPTGTQFLFMAHGCYDDTAQAGLRRTDTLHKAAHRALALHFLDAPPCLLISSHLPYAGTVGAQYLDDVRRICGDWFLGAIALFEDHADGSDANHDLFARVLDHDAALLLRYSTPAPRPVEPVGLSMLRLFDPDISDAHWSDPDLEVS